MIQLLNIFIFPGFLFLFIFGLWGEYFDRKLYAKFQNRVGPPWFQPLADIIKLISKEDLIPTEANEFFFKAAPVFAMAAVITSFFYMPLWQPTALASFNGDMVVVLYLLTIPTFAIFIGGWYSTSLFARIGSVRNVTQLFAYEVPLLMGILSAAMLAGTWSLSEMAAFYTKHPLFILINAIGFVVSLVSLQGKLEKAPFDIPEAETEIVAGGFTEYGGRLLAMLRISLDMEMVVGASLIAAVYLPFGLSLPPVIAFIVYMLKIIGIMFLLALGRTIFARMRMDQMIAFCWKYLVPLSLLQFFIILLVREMLFK
jgi:NADH-quinone oxidoreductase subunit H